MEELISGVHNYCDRWCQRCKFIQRCAVGQADIQKFDEKDMSPEKFAEALQNIFGDLQAQLTEFLGDFEFEEPTDEEIHEDKVHHLMIDTHPLSLLSEKYYMQVFEMMNTLIEVKGHEWEVIGWYHVFLHIKFKRAIHGLRDANDEMYADNPYQTDSNGSAKIAIIAVEHSIIAWKRLFDRDPNPAFQKMLFLLKQIHQTAQQTFPDYEKFVRAGFDD